MNNILKILRKIVRDRIYSVINIIGFAVSISAALIIALWVENELMFNRSYKKSIWCKYQKYCRDAY